MTGPHRPQDPQGQWDHQGNGPAERHPGYANYPVAGTQPERPRAVPQPIPAQIPHPRIDRQPIHSNNPHLPPLRGSEQPRNSTTDGLAQPAQADIPRKITVTRVAAMRSRELTSKGIATFQRAAKADGAEKSGLTALTYAVMANFATDAAMAVALANTLFFAAAKGESQSKVALYLLITIAPFAVIAPLIGPALDRLQQGRRLALAGSFIIRTVLAIILIANFDSATGNFPGWVLYPCALAMMVLSKSFGVLKAAVTPRVLPPEIDLVRVNSRLTVFGLVGGTIGAGAIAGAAELGLGRLFGIPGALWLIVIITGLGAYLSMQIPAWVEVTEGE
ncbi:MAG: MFS transporter, partial [Mycobacteriaceae bacterium]